MNDGQDHPSFSETAATSEIWERDLPALRRNDPARSAKMIRSQKMNRIGAKIDALEKSISELDDKIDRLQRLERYGGLWMDLCTYFDFTH